MLTPRRHRDAGYAAGIAGEIYGGGIRADPSRATELLHATTRLGPARGYYYQLLVGLGWTSLPLLPLLRQPTLIMATVYESAPQAEDLSRCRAGPRRRGGQRGDLRGQPDGCVLRSTTIDRGCTVS